MGRAMKVHFEQCPSSPASKAASFQIPPLGVVCFSPLGTEEPESPWVQRGKPRAQPMGGVVYFGDLPLDEPEETGILSPFIHKALPPRSSQKPPRKETPIKTRSTPESTLVLELEGILVCCSLTSSQDADCTFLTDFQGDAYRVYMKLRPHVQEFLETLSKAYEIFVFTTAKQDYTEKILDVLDPQKKLIRFPTGSRSPAGWETARTRSCCVSSRCWGSSAKRVTSALKSRGNTVSAGYWLWTDVCPGTECRGKTPSQKSVLMGCSQTSQMQSAALLPGSSQQQHKL
ncbi:uncharacterized protein LOC101943031 isoform X5 [Chrysemys picta bellii]